MEVGVVDAGVVVVDVVVVVVVVDVARAHVSGHTNPTASCWHEPQLIAVLLSHLTLYWLKRISS